MATTTKAMMARELDALRHEVSQLRADNARMREQLQARAATCDGQFATRRDAMNAAREQAMRTGCAVKVQW